MQQNTKIVVVQHMVKTLMIHQPFRHSARVCKMVLSKFC